MMWIVLASNLDYKLCSPWGLHGYVALCNHLLGPHLLQQRVLMLLLFLRLLIRSNGDTIYHPHCLDAL